MDEVHSTLQAWEHYNCLSYLALAGGAGVVPAKRLMYRQSAHVQSMQYNSSSADMGMDRALTEADGILVLFQFKATWSKGCRSAPG